MKSSEIFYFDVDGTILDNDTQKITKNTIDSLNKLKQMGYKVAIATGRTSAALNDPEIQTVFEWDGYVLANGGSIMDKDMNVIKEHLCEPEFIHSIIKHYPGTIVLEGYKNYVVNDLSSNMVDFLGEVANVLEVMEEYQGEPVLNIIIEDVNLIKDGFNNPIFKDYDYFINTGNMFEIFPKGSGKDVAVREFNELLNVKRHTYFGDGNNDTDAVREADFGVVMNNGSDATKAVADYITKSVGEDGVSFALKHFEII